MALMDINLTGATFTDYHLVNVGVGAFQLEHDWFTKEDLVIRTAPAWGGTLLIEGTDYTLGMKSNELSARVSAAGPTRQVFHKITIINASYQTGDLYFSGKYIADSNEAGDINDLQDQLGAHAALTGSSAHGAVSAPTANQIITRDGAGRAQVVAPSATADIARKDTVDAVQTNLTNHAALTNPHSATAAATADRLVLRDGAGRAQIVAPSADADIAIKGWVRDFIYPVGSYYTQYPDAASNIDSVEFPTSQRPETLFGGTWAEQWPTESVYFRTRGTLSDTGRASGKQEDQFQGHRHDMMDSNTTIYCNGGGGDRGFNFAGPSANTGWSKTGSPLIDGVPNGTPRTGAETRVVNRRIKVWKRTA